jgi:hypothetical protein
MLVGMCWLIPWDSLFEKLRKLAIGYNSPTERKLQERRKNWEKRIRKVSFLLAQSGRGRRWSSEKEVFFRGNK